MRWLHVALPLALLIGGTMPTIGFADTQTVPPVSVDPNRPCTGERCDLPPQPAIECQGQNCLPPEDNPVVTCEGQDCLPKAGDPVETCEGLDCTPEPPDE